MIHLVFHSLNDNILFQRIGSGDDVVFFENSIFSLTKDGVLNKDLQGLLKNNVRLYSLLEDIETRGLSENELVTGVQMIDYSELVILTEKNKLIRTWS